MQLWLRLWKACPPASRFLRFDVACGHRPFGIAQSSAASILNFSPILMTKGFSEQTQVLFGKKGGAGQYQPTQEKKEEQAQHPHLVIWVTHFPACKPDYEQNATDEQGYRSDGFLNGVELVISSCISSMHEPKLT